MQTYSACGAAISCQQCPKAVGNAIIYASHSRGFHLPAQKCEENIMIFLLEGEALVNSQEYAGTILRAGEFILQAVQWFELLQQPKEEIESIFVKSDYKLVQIELKKILYVEGLKDYVKIYTEDTARPILSLMSMKSMEELLPTSRFMRVHRSYIVQKEKIRVIDRGRIVFDKTYIPVSDSYKQVFQTFLDKRS